MQVARERTVDVRELLLVEVVVGIEREVPVLGRLYRTTQPEIMGKPYQTPRIRTATSS